MRKKCRIYITYSKPKCDDDFFTGELLLTEEKIVIDFRDDDEQRRIYTGRSVALGHWRFDANENDGEAMSLHRLPSEGDIDDEPFVGEWFYSEESKGYWTIVLDE